MTNFIIIAVLIIVLGIALFYIVKEKKKGTVCVGCPHAGTCGAKCDPSTSSGCGCH